MRHDSYHFLITSGCCSLDFNNLLLEFGGQYSPESTFILVKIEMSNFNIIYCQIFEEMYFPSQYMEV